MLLLLNPDALLFLRLLSPSSTDDSSTPESVRSSGGEEGRMSFGGSVTARVCCRLGRRQDPADGSHEDEKFVVESCELGSTADRNDAVDECVMHTTI